MCLWPGRIDVSGRPLLSEATQAEAFPLWVFPGQLLPAKVADVIIQLIYCVLVVLDLGIQVGREKGVW